MKHCHSRMLGAVLGLLALPALAQEPQKEQPQDKKEVARPEGEARKSTSQLIEQLGDAGFRNRKAAEDKLRELGKDALKELNAAAENHDDPEVRWRARRLADRIERGDEGGLRPRRAPNAQPPDHQPPVRTLVPTWRDQFRTFGQPQDLDSLFDSLFEQLERDFQLDIPRRQFFNDDFFRDLQKQMRDQMRGMPGQGPDRSESMTMSSGPDGVRVEIKKKDQDGKIDTKVYEAPDMDSFRAKYPEVAQRLFGGGGFQFRIGPMDLSPMGGWNVTPRMPNQLRGFDVWPQPQQDVPAAGERLGVQVTELSEEQRDELKLDEGVGLHVQSVVEGTLAEKLGIQEGDVVVEVAGEKVGSPQDVRGALQKVAAGETVKVTVSRDGKSQTLEAKKPGTQDEGAAGKTEDGGKLRKRQIR